MGRRGLTSCEKKWRSDVSEKVESATQVFIEQLDIVQKGLCT